MPPERVTLDAARVDVWRIDIEDHVDRLPALQGWLNDEERSRAFRFVHERKQRQFIIARAALRDILGRYLGRGASEVAFDYTEHGKPRLSGEQGKSGLRFNLSHSRDLALCAVTLNRETGIDTEYIRPDRADESIARRFFARDEVKALLALDEADRAAAFYHCWTSKEAYVKALGDGLRRPLDTFCVSVNPELAALLHVDGHAEEAGQWVFEALPVPADYMGVCAVSGASARWRFFRWRITVDMTGRLP